MRRKITISIFVILSLRLLLSIYNYWDMYRYKYDIFGYNFKVVKDIFYEDTDRDFHGDGMSVSIDSISEDAVTYFKNPSDIFFSSYPKHVIQSSFKIHKWQRTPINSIDTLPISFVYNWWNTGECAPFIFKNDSAVSDGINAIASVLKDTGNFYAYAFKYDLKNIRGIDLYVIDLKGKKIYNVNRQ